MGAYDILDYDAIGHRIRDKRKSLGWKQRDLSDRVELTIGYVGNIERGIRIASIETYVLLAVILGMTLDELIMGIPSEPANSLEKEHRINTIMAGIEAVVRSSIH